MLLRDDNPTDLIDLPPIYVTAREWERRTAYRIDPLMGARVIVIQADPAPRDRTPPRGPHTPSQGDV